METLNELSGLAEAVISDKELAYAARGLSGVFRIDLPGRPVDIVFINGRVVDVRDVSGDADVELAGTEGFWKAALRPGNPEPGYESVSSGQSHGLTVVGDERDFIAPYALAIQRLYKLVREAFAGPVERKPYSNPFRDTDTAVGRYIYVTANGVESRIYYEEAGTGSVPLLLQATAGADGRQYRHLLADPAMQRRFHMYAYDLPYHGKSLPPIGVRWWEQPYLITREGLIEWVTAIADALELEDPVFMGCSVGGQLALDLAAERPDRFSAFVSLNGWYDVPDFFATFDNDRFRTPELSSDYAPAMNFGATTPFAPESDAHEVYWIYRSAFPGIYAGDNDYFMTGHDLKVNGSKIDAFAKPVYVVAGQYDPASLDPVHGGPAVASNIPGVEFRELVGLGHFAPCDDPVDFNKAIVQILDEVLSRLSAVSAPTTV